MNKTIILFRLAATCFLVCMIYRETGVYTAFTIGLIGIVNEMQHFVLRKHLECINMLKDLAGK